MAALAGCQVIIGIHDETGVEPTPDATIPPDPCVKALPPEPPDAAPEDSGGELADEITFAIQTFVVVPSSSQPLGYDLDERCTGNPHSTTNAPPCRPSVSADPAYVVDGDGGID